MKTFLVHPDRYKLIVSKVANRESDGADWMSGIKVVICSWLPLVDSEGNEVLGFWFDENNLRMRPYAEGEKQ